MVLWTISSGASLASLEEGPAFLGSLTLAKKSQANAASTSERPAWPPTAMAGGRNPQLVRFW
jgi:hypothetical protein